MLGRVNSVELASLNNSSGPWGLSLVAWYLVLGLIWGKGYIGLAAWELDKEPVGRMTGD